MKATILLSLTISALLASASCGIPTSWKEKSKPSSQIFSTNTEENRTVQNFNAIQVSTGIAVQFTQSNDYQVKINANPDILPHIKTTLEGTTLKIYVDAKGEKNLRTGDISIEVHAPHLVMTEVDSGANFELKNTLIEDNFRLSTNSGADFKGSLTIANQTQINIDSGADATINLNTKSVAIHVNSGGNLNLKGSANHATLDVNSSGDCNAAEFIVTLLKANADSSGTIKAYVTETIQATANSSGSIYYKGTPTKVEVKTDTSGSVNKVD